MWFVGILRVLFITLDMVLFWAIEKVYGLFTMIAETGVFSPEVISTFAGRIYVLLGVFMLFKVSFSLITYILNPDTLTDKSKGMGNLVKRTIIVLVGIIAVPYIFQAAYSLQAIILKDNIIGSIILGREAANIDISKGDYIEQGGKIMSHTVFTSFIRLNPAVVGKNCANNPVQKDGDGYSLNSKCNHEIFQQSVGQKSSLEEILVKSYKDRDSGLLLDSDLILLKSEQRNSTNVDWVFDYSIVFSTLVGGLLAWVLLLFCIDIGIRSVKLGFLQLIAPIPVISYIEPKGEKIFQSWLSECIKTYVDLFIRLVAIYFVIFIVVVLETSNTYSLITGETQDDIFVKLFIIIGALMFANQIPDLISNILGIKLSGGFTLNPMKKIGQSTFASGAAGLVGGAVGGFAANAWAAGRNKNWAGLIPSAIAGGASSGFRGARFGLASGGKGSALDGITKGIKASSQARNLRGKGYGLYDQIMDKATDLAGVKFSTGTSSHLKNEVNQLQQELANAKRNEQNAGAALQHLLSQQGSRTGALIRTFDGAYQRNADGSIKKDANGYLMYEEKTYENYRRLTAREQAISDGADWDNADEATRKAIIANYDTQGLFASEATFNSLNATYVARNNADNEGRVLEKRINDLQEDMTAFKDRNK